MKDPSVTGRFIRSHEVQRAATVLLSHTTTRRHDFDSAPTKFLIWNHHASNQMLVLRPYWMLSRCYQSSMKELWLLRGRMSSLQTVSQAPSLPIDCCFLNERFLRVDPQRVLLTLSNIDSWMLGRTILSIITLRQTLSFRVQRSWPWIYHDIVCSNVWTQSCL